jgi:hypothetical protein
MDKAINFLETFIEQRSTATLAEYKQVVAALNDLRAFVKDHTEMQGGVEPAEPKKGKKIPFPGSVSDREA